MTKKISSSSKRLLNSKFMFFLLVLLGLIFLIGELNSFKTSFARISEESLFVHFLPTSTPKPTATRSPSPTPTLAPTPTPYTGFCLNVPILVYHHVQPMSKAREKGNGGLTVEPLVFEQQMAYLNAKGYITISALQLINALITKSGLPGKPMVMTIDDGYRDIFDYAYPILQKYRIVANLAIPTGLMEGENYLTWNQIREMKGSGLVYYLNHTWSHYNAGKGNDEKIRWEIQSAKDQIEKNIGQANNLFVYPYGLPTNQTIKILKELGYLGAFSTIPGYVQCDSFMMSLHRTRIGNSPLSFYGL